MAKRKELHGSDQLVFPDLPDTESAEGQPADKVECLGITFDKEEEKQQYFEARLREKLEDFNFRSLPGFPEGADEAIVALSRPPYFTACPNPFVSSFAKAGDLDIDYRQSPLALDVSQGKSDPLYSAHTYHTKVPPKAICQYILWYTNPGDLVLDPFAGSGMTGVGARLASKPLPAVKKELDQHWRQLAGTLPAWGSRRTILSDLSPAAAFIAHNYNFETSANKVRRELDVALAEIQSSFSWMYTTAHTGWPAGERDPAKWRNLRRANTTAGKVIVVIWSEILSCPECGNEIEIWKDAVDPIKAVVRNSIPCGNCAAENTKRSLERAPETVFDAYLDRPRTTNRFRPVFVIYEVDGRRFEKRPDSEDIATIRKTRELRAANSPIVPMMCSAVPAWGAMHRAGYHRGVTHLHHFYTERNWFLLAELWSKVSSPGAKFVLTSLMPRLSRMHALHLKNFFKGGGGFAAGNRKGQLYLPSLALELSPFSYLPQRARAATVALQSAGGGSETFVSVGSAESLPLPEESVDYIFGLSFTLCGRVQARDLRSRGRRAR